MSSKESLGGRIGQEEMPWDPYADLAGVVEAAENAGEGQLSAEPERMTRQEKQTLGVAAIAGMIESGLPEEEKSDAEGDEETILGEMNTLVMRARQGVGEKAFVELAHNVSDLAATNLPETVMKYFRESPEVALMDAGELWQAILAQDKMEKFGSLEEYTEKGKFYYSMSLADFRKALEEGKIERTDKSGNCLKSDLELAGDYCDENDEWKSGFADAKMAKEDADVTLVLDGSLVKAEDFVTLGKLTVDTIDLEKYCLGFVTDTSTTTGRRVNQAVRKSDLYGIPVYQEQDVDGSGWATSMYPADYLRFMAQEYGEKMQNYRKDRAEVYEEVDREGLRERIEKFAQKMQRDGMEKMVLQYDGKLEDEKKRKQLGQDLERYYAGVLSVEEMPEIEWTYDVESSRRGNCHVGKNGNPDKITLNWARLEEDGLRGVVRTLGHEMRHVYQRDLVKKWKENAEDLTEDEQRLAELFDVNFRNHIKSKDDAYAYRNQLIEADAQTFAMACEGAYMRARREVSRPMNRVKRGAEAVRRGAAELTYRGKRVAKGGAERIKKAGKKNG